MSTERRSPLVSLLALFAVLMLGFVGIGYAMGWIEFRDETERTTIEFDKSEAEADTEYAVERTGEFIKDTGKSLKEAGSSVTEDDDPSPSDDVDADISVETSTP